MKEKRRFRILIILAIAIMALPAALALWTEKAEALAHYTPDCARVDLLPILQKDVPDVADYAVLFQQTGLAKAGVDELYASGQQWELLGLQERFLAQVEIACSCGDLFIRSERLSDFSESACSEAMVRQCEALAGTNRFGREAFCFLPAVQDGDILITFSGHIFGWRSGHAAIVVDAERRLTLEAIMPGCNSKICSLDDWQMYPGFALLRLKDASREERGQIAAYAQEYLIDLPYRLTVFNDLDGIDKSGMAIPVIDEEAEASGCSDGYAPTYTPGERQEQPADTDAKDGHGQPPLTGTQCAHLVWFAYMRFGYNLDSNGGFIVTPGNLYRSDLLELVQIYGLNPD